MSRTDTWMPLYIGDYLADTMHLTALEHGAYLLLIMTYWRGGPLPDCDAKLARIARCKGAEWESIKDTIREFFRAKDGLLFHRRIENERKKAQKNRKISAENGRKGGLAKAENSKRNQDVASGRQDSASDLLEIRQTPSPSPSPLPSQEEKKEPKATPLGATAPPQRDPEKEFFDEAKPLLISLTGMSPSAAGGFLVKLVRRAKDNRAHVIDALRSADEQRPLQPQGWLMEAVEIRARSQGKLDWVMDEYARMGDVH